jgi:hypothetical protein
MDSYSMTAHVHQPKHIESVRISSNLPDELLVHILRYSLLLPGKVSALSSMQLGSRKLIHTLVLVSQHMRSLASQIFYGENTFVLKAVRRKHTERLRMHWPSPTISHWIQNLEVHVRLRAYSEPTTDWSILVQPLDTSAPSLWWPRMRKRPDWA